MKISWDNTTAVSLPLLPPGGVNSWELFTFLAPDLFFLQHPSERLNQCQEMKLLSKCCLMRNKIYTENSYKYINISIVNQIYLNLKTSLVNQKKFAKNYLTPYYNDKM